MMKRPQAAGTVRSVWVGLVALIACVLPAAMAGAQDDEGATRKLWDTAFKSAEGQGTSRRRGRARRYRVATPAVPTEGVAGETAIGVTIWRVRPATLRDAGERLLVQEAAGAAAWVPERVSAGAPLKEGDRVRLSIEAARAGYLYIINREEHAGGSLGDPYLIFPTRRTHGGRNEVRGGRVIEIPAQEDDPPFFTLKRGHSRQVGEVLSVIVAPAPLEGLEIGENAQRLPAEQVAAWERSWGAKVGRLELEGVERQAWTKVEREAGADRTRTLAADDPAPQILFYSPLAAPAKPFLVNVSLKYGRPPARRRAPNR